MIERAWYMMKRCLECVLVMMGLIGCIPETDRISTYSGEDCGPGTGVECPTRDEIEDWCDNAPPGWRCISNGEVDELKRRSVEMQHQVIDCQLERNGLMQRLCEEEIDGREFCFDETPDDED